MNYSEVTGDLFSSTNGHTLVHCISSDCKMGAGIALEFNNRFPDMKSYCLSLNPMIGDALFYHNKEKKVFNLVTKKFFHHKPTYYDLEHSLISMKRQLKTLNISQLAMPRIGCGLDRLNWGKVQGIIKSTFVDTDIEIVIYNL